MNPQPTTNRSRQRLWVAGGAAVAVIASVVVGIVLTAGTREEAAVESTIEAFSAAVDRGDMPAVLSLLCAEEANAVVNDDEDPTAAATDPEQHDREILGINITDTTATAEMRVDKNPAVTLSLVKDRDGWKLCAPETS
jgi:hypothetical protein